jgi:hypothetical protein
MRLNDGLPVWHASVSLQTPAGAPLGSAGRIERAAVALLRGVGGSHEWWLWNSRAKVGHLRVPVTAEEHEQVPPGCATADAGESGLKRRRSSR